jgi:hypothetical protein
VGLAQLVKQPTDDPKFKGLNPVAAGIIKKTAGKQFLKVMSIKFHLV